MSHKDYNLEIVGLLLRGPNHVRGIAQALGTNQTTIARKTAQLRKENVLDFKIEGKNKTFFLKKTTEARIHVYLWEHYTLLKTLKTYPFLRKLIDEAKKTEVLVLLFGSYAKGIAKEDSDIDLFVETIHNSLKEHFEQIDSRLSVQIGSYVKHSALIKEIEKNHVILNHVEEYYAKTSFFG
ncbi:MAG TPA: nucleotidyltransferase domain-containing protein [Candidatus Nanoarchaeia archaeon]|nr:nucleotidyltransferase domain-containing protein [Candidatus Nanoarchaeia archaeon]